MARPLDRVDRRDREVGIVVAVTPSGHLTLRATGPDPAPEGTRVVDRGGRLTGRVARVFGPVARPYLAVRLPRPPRPSDGAALVGTAMLRERRRTDAQR